MKKKGGLIITRFSNSSIYIANKLYEEGIISYAIFIKKKNRSKLFNFLKKLQNRLIKKEHNELTILKKNFTYINKSIKCFYIQDFNLEKIKMDLNFLKPNLIIFNDFFNEAKNLSHENNIDVLNISLGPYPLILENIMQYSFLINKRPNVGFTLLSFLKDNKNIKILCSEEINVQKEDNFYSLYLKIIFNLVEYLCNGLIISGHINQKIRKSKIKVFKPNNMEKFIINMNYVVPFFANFKLYFLKLRLYIFSSFDSTVKSFLGLFGKLILPKNHKIFMYHEVSDEPSEFSKNYNLAVSKKVFEKQIKWISKNFDIIDPTSLLKPEKISISKRKKAIITFDDGYESIFLNAAPILRKYGIKAIIFINMAPVNKELFWPGLIHYLESKDYLFKAYMKKKYKNNPFSFLFYKEEDIKKYSQANKTKLFNKKVNLYQGSFPSKKMLIDNNDVFIYGNHLYNHFNAANLSKKQFLYQIKKNTIELKKINSKSEFFSYPFGQPVSCYDKSTDKILKEQKNIQKIFYANSQINNSFNEKYLYRCALPSNLKVGLYNYFCFFRPFLGFYKSTLIYQSYKKLFR